VCCAGGAGLDSGIDFWVRSWCWRGKGSVLILY
jgi:hypothetical protein